MFNELQENSRVSASALTATWRQTEQLWRDDGQAYFASHHWLPLEADVEVFQEALGELMSILYAAEQATNF